MIRRLGSVVAVVVFLLIVSFPALCDSEIKKTNHSSKTVYMAKSGLEDDRTWDIRWSTDYSVAGPWVIYSEKKWDGTDSSFVGKVYSIVGPYVSYKGESGGYAEGAAHPWHTSYFETINIKNGEKVKLTDLFDHDEIFKAMLKDSVIKKALGGQSPKNLVELLEKADGGCEFNISESSLESFAFHHIKNNTVAVRVGLTHGCEAMRGNFTQLGFYLPIPKSMNSYFNRANKNNLLMNTMAQLQY